MKRTRESTTTSCCCYFNPTNKNKRFKYNNSSSSNMTMTPDSFTTMSQLPYEIYLAIMEYVEVSIKHLFDSLLTGAANFDESRVVRTVYGYMRENPKHIFHLYPSISLTRMLPLLQDNRRLCNIITRGSSHIRYQNQLSPFNTDYTRHELTLDFLQYVFANNRRVVSVDLSQNYCISDSHSNKYKVLTTCPNLTHVNLNHSFPRENHVEELLRGCSKLKVFKLKNDNEDDRGLDPDWDTDTYKLGVFPDLFRSLFSNDTLCLESLDLTCNALTDNQVKFLLSSQCGKRIVHLNLSMNESLTHRAFDLEEPNSTLKHLDISGLQCDTDLTMKSIFTTFTSLTTLVASNCDLVHFMKKLPKCSSLFNTLAVLNLDNNANLEYPDNLPPFRRLRVISLKRCPKVPSHWLLPDCNCQIL